MKTVCITLIVSLLIFSCSQSDSPEPDHGSDNFSFSSFSSTDASKINLAGLALFESSQLILNKSTTTGMGYAYYNKLVNVANGFETSFSFTISDLGGLTDENGNNGGDGIAFSVFNSDTTTFKTNTRWYTGIANSIGIEFDTFNNGTVNDDPNGNHIGIYATGNNVGESGNITKLDLTSSIADFSSAGTHTVKLVYQSKTLTVYLDGTIALNTSVDLSTQLQLDNDKAYIGLSSFSGMATENHIINNWQFKAY